MLSWYSPLFGVMRLGHVGDCQSNSLGPGQGTRFPLRGIRVYVSSNKEQPWRMIAARETESTDLSHVRRNSPDLTLLSIEPRFRTDVKSCARYEHVIVVGLTIRSYVPF